jgi:predicted ester cyclase
MIDRRTFPAALLAVLTLSLSTPVLAVESVRINDLVVAAPIPDAQRDATLKAVRAFYDFWNTGDEALLKEAIAPNFTDHTLPPGRPQGPEGPAFASRQFRTAVPDLNVTVEKMIVAGDYVTVHMRFGGHFTGRFGQTQGEGQPIPFIATDLVKIENGRITDNWHIEDNFTLLQQMGVVKVVAGKQEIAR